MSSRLVRSSLAAVALASIALAWPAWRAWQVERSLAAVQTDVARLRVELGAGDTAGATSTLTALQTQADRADRATHGPTWMVLRHLPGYGDDAAAVATVSGALAVLTRTGLRPLAASVAQPAAFMPQNGQVPVATLTRLAPAVSTASTAFAAADAQLAVLDADRLHSPVAGRVAVLRAQVAAVGRQLHLADQALEVLPGMLGADGPRTYLLVVQNNAEIRSTGGLPGANLLLHVDDGTITIARQATAGVFPEAAAPVLPLTSAELQIYGRQLGIFYVDAGFTPDFPRAATLWRAWWQQTYPSDQIDGVLAMDPVTLSYLLGATGPVQVGSDVISQSDAVDDLLHETYLNDADPNAQDAHFQQVAQAVFTRLTTAPGDPTTVIAALARATDEGRLRLYPFRAGDQQMLAGTEIEGALPVAATSTPQVGVYLDDTTGSKMSYYLRYAALVRATSCRGGVQQLTGSATLTSTAPTDAATLPVSITGGDARGVPSGHHLVAVRIFGPTQGAVTEVELDGRPLKVRVVEQAGRPVASVFIDLRPQQTSALSWAMTTGPQQIGRGRVDVTPSVVAGTSSSSFESAC